MGIRDRTCAGASVACGATGRAAAALRQCHLTPLAQHGQHRQPCRSFARQQVVACEQGAAHGRQATAVTAHRRVAVAHTCHAHVTHKSRTSHAQVTQTVQQHCGLQVAQRPQIACSTRPKRLAIHPARRTTEDQRFAEFVPAHANPSQIRPHDRPCNYLTPASGLKLTR